MLKQTIFTGSALFALVLIHTSLFSQQSKPIGQAEKYVNVTSTASAYVVSNTNDNGPGSLREAINKVQTTAGMDTIRFHIPDTDANYDASAGVWRIRLQTGLPWLTQGGTVIDGYSQAILYGANTNLNGPEIVLDGQVAGVYANGITIPSSGNIVQGLAIQHFANNGVYIEGDENTIIGNFIGTNATGTDTASNNVGVAIASGSHNVIGGTAPDARNIISGNRNKGISVNGTESDSNRIVGNFIGTDVTGTAALGNGAEGIEVYPLPVNTIIGGATQAAMNLISGNKVNGISLWANHTTIVGNKIGTDVTGTLSLANGNGILVASGRQNIIGGTRLGEANIISGNMWRGIIIWADSN